MTGLRGDGTGDVPLGDLFEIFQPGLRHLREERERKRIELVQPGDADPAWVDLDAGVAVLYTALPADRPVDELAAADDEADDADDPTGDR